MRCKTYSILRHVHVHFAREHGTVFLCIMGHHGLKQRPSDAQTCARLLPCRFLIAAGDPCQLPPVLTSPTGVTAAASAACSDSIRGSGRQQQQGLLYGLLRPLFVRLTHLGHKEHLLTHQYRYAHTLLGSLGFLMF